MPIRKINSIKEVLDFYDYFIIDVWGVLHSGGKTAFPEAIELLAYLKKKNKFIIILSNSPRNRIDNEKSLANLGITKNNYDLLHSSGEEVKQLLAKREHFFFSKLGKKAFLIGYSDLHLSAKDSEEKDINKADYILATRVPGEKLETAIPILDQGLSLGLALVCANPDEISCTIDGLSPCPGILYKYYKEHLGTAIAIGKPNPEVYQNIFDIISNLGQQLSKTRTLIIGDGLFTDILGANRQGIDSVLISSGIHSQIIDFETLPEIIDLNDFQLLTDQNQASPKFICEIFT